MDEKASNDREWDELSRERLLADAAMPGTREAYEAYQGRTLVREVELALDLEAGQ